MPLDAMDMGWTSPARLGLHFFLLLATLAQLQGGSRANAEDMRKFVLRAVHCTKNILSYREAPPDQRPNFALSVGRIVSVVEQMTAGNKVATLKYVYKSGQELNPHFYRSFPSCVEDPCSAEPEPGTCLQNMVMFYFDRNANACHQFSYHGCGRNFNIFNTLEACQEVCTGYD